jgi:uncharacterized protein YdhG (YjbR/CyaY superfamily)
MTPLELAQAAEIVALRRALETALSEAMAGNVLGQVYVDEIREALSLPVPELAQAVQFAIDAWSDTNNILTNKAINVDLSPEETGIQAVSVRVQSRLDAAMGKK